jgi:hypothetical protein
MEINIMEESNKADVELYLRHHLSLVQSCRAYNLSHEWPGEENIQQLVRTSAGLFIWASTAVKYIETGYHPQHGLDTLLKLDTRAEAEFALDALYATALTEGGIWDRKDSSNDFCAVLGALSWRKFHCRMQPWTPF